MLLEAVELQQKAVSQLIEKIEIKDEITFRAPTGSGKTYMMADMMNQILSKNSDVIFLVSSLSKGGLAKQNYDKFCSYKVNGEFPELKAHLISSEIAGEERLFIPTNYNVYVLPRDLYKQGGRLMQGAMENFLNTLTLNKAFHGLGKQIYLVKDECHIDTKNLDNLSEKLFTKVINFSATPNLSRGQNPDVEIRDDDAVNAKLIKQIELGDEAETVGDAIEKFESIKGAYRDMLGVNPCLIIQISNKDKGAEELERKVFSELHKASHQDLKWMLIVDNPKDCDTNDVFKAKKLPVSRWKDYAKENTATIDIIIFKMVISEGWDIPRACMLYQVRDTKSTQLDEQVMGRVRRNPRLLDFESLSEEAQKLAMTAWIWGIIPEAKKRIYSVKLWDEAEDITDNICLQTTRLKKLERKEGFNIETYLDSKPDISSYSNIFDLYRKLKKSDSTVRDLCYSYADDYSKWWKFAENIDAINREREQYVCDYAQSMELVTDEQAHNVTVSFSVESQYTDNGNYVNIGDWVWRRKDGQNRFAFDSEAERAWASLLQGLAAEDLDDTQRICKRVKVGKKNPKAGLIDILTGAEPDRINVSNKYLWGKNYLVNSAIKYEYCLDGVHSSYPDFIMKDSYDRIHIFEVKSVNISNATPAAFDAIEYKRKVEELKRCYKQASILTGHIFYLPVLKDDSWQIICLNNGDESRMTESQFRVFIVRKP